MECRLVRVRSPTNTTCPCIRRAHGSRPPPTLLPQLSAEKLSRRDFPKSSSLSRTLRECRDVAALPAGCPTQLFAGTRCPLPKAGSWCSHPTSTKLRTGNRPDTHPLGGYRLWISLGAFIALTTFIASGHKMWRRADSSSGTFRAAERAESGSTEAIATAVDASPSNHFRWGLQRAKACATVGCDS